MIRLRRTSARRVRDEGPAAVALWREEGDVRWLSRLDGLLTRLSLFSTMEALYGGAGGEAS